MELVLELSLTTYFTKNEKDEDLLNIRSTSKRFKEAYDKGHRLRLVHNKPLFLTKASFFESCFIKNRDGRAAIDFVKGSIKILNKSIEKYVKLFMKGRMTLEQIRNMYCSSWVENVAVPEFKINAVFSYDTALRGVVYTAVINGIEYSYDICAETNLHKRGMLTPVRQRNAESRLALCLIQMYPFLPIIESWLKGINPPAYGRWRLCKAPNNVVRAERNFDKLATYEDATHCWMTRDI
jgi:hypothetical protein